jgi:hypothetical protein
MKTVNLSCFLLLLFSFSSILLFSKESVPDFSIVKSELDKTLTKSEAVFVFNFYNSDEAGMKSSTIKYSYNGINKTEKTDKYGKITLKVKPGKYKFQFFYNETFYEIKTDFVAIKPSYKTEVEIRFSSSIHPVSIEKPVIYIYSPQDIEVKIKLDVKGNLDFTYPKYNNGWEFTTAKDGLIKMNDKTYSYLFWDGKMNINSNDINLKEGFVVNKENLVSFFENKLSKMGLSVREMEDYITYWCPIMNVNEKNYIHFMFNEGYNEYANLSVTPKPDNQFRVFMVWSKAEGNTFVKEQHIPSFTREGFTLVEWGGANFENMQEITAK